LWYRWDNITVEYCPFSKLIFDPLCRVGPYFSIEPPGQELLVDSNLLLKFTIRRQQTMLVDEPSIIFD
jgi:hypothetical protein